MEWTVRFHDAFEPEFEELEEDLQDELLAHLNVLRQFPPDTWSPFSGYT